MINYCVECKYCKKYITYHCESPKLYPQTYITKKDVIGGFASTARGNRLICHSFEKKPTIIEKIKGLFK